MTTTKTRPKLSGFQQRLAEHALQHDFYPVPTPRPESTGGVALGRAITRYAVDPFSNPPSLRLGCSHAQPGVASLLLLDEDCPKVRCVECATAYPPTLTIDQELCRVCGTGSKRFHELIIFVARDNLTISVNLCPLCHRDLTRDN